jgi:26S proteasome non-ATPase regulatory subunit 9
MKASIKKLMQKKDSIEEEINVLYEILNSPGANGSPPVGIKGKLVDDEGFPRADVDVHNILIMRNRFICLQNDHKAVMKDIAEALVALHSFSRPQASPEAVTVDEPSATSIPLESKTDALESDSALPTPTSGFAIVDELSDDSPAQEAGLQLGDELVSFGVLRTAAFGLAPLATIVQRSVGQPINVSVFRVVGEEKQLLQLSLVPHAWSGRGLLGYPPLPLHSIYPLYARTLRTPWHALRKCVLFPRRNEFTVTLICFLLAGAISNQ